MEALNLTGRKGLVVGIANEHSLAWSAAQHFHEASADLAITYLNNKAKPFVEPLARQLSAPIFLPCNVSEPGQLEAVFQTIKQFWGRLDFEFHAIAWARKEDLDGRLTDYSAEGFAESMLISCHSFIRMARLAEPLLDNGGSLMTLSSSPARSVAPRSYSPAIIRRPLPARCFMSMPASISKAWCSTDLSPLHLPAPIRL